MKRVVFDIAALIARVIIGVIFLAHGLQKWQQGLGATTEGFRRSGVPEPQLAAAFSTVGETLGGILLILGLLVRPAALVLLISMIGAFVFVHRGGGIFMAEGGWELVGALGSAALLFLALGGGRLGLDGIFNAARTRRARRRAAERDLAAHGPRTSMDRPASGHTGEHDTSGHSPDRPASGYADEPGASTPPDERPAYPDERPASGYPDEHGTSKGERPAPGYPDERGTSTGERPDHPPAAGRPEETRQAGPVPDHPDDTRHTTPRQHPGARPGGLSDEDMRDVDALVDDQPPNPKPPNR